MTRLAQRVIAVAGGGGRIGAAATLRLAAEGATVAIGDMDTEVASQLSARIVAEGGTALGLHLDIGEERSVIDFFEQVRRDLGPVNGLFANAADTSPATAASDTDVVDLSLDVFETTMRVNLLGHLLCARSAIPQLLDNGGGGIVFTSSCDAFDGQPTRPCYSMSKVALTALARHIAARWGKDGVRANTVLPGLVATDTIGDRPAPGSEAFRETYLTRTRSHRLGKGDDIAAAVSFLLSDDGEWVTGQSISVDGGLLLR